MYITPYNLVKRFQNHLMKMIMKPFWGAVAGAAVSGLMQNRAAKKAASAQREAGELAYQRSLPGTTKGLFGEASYSGKDATLSLAPDLQAQYDRLMGRAGTTAEQVGKYSADPFAAQQQLYEQQRGLFAPQREKERLSREARLLAQGRLGTTGGAGEIEAAETAYGMQDLARQVGSFDQAQQMLTQLRAREAADIQQGLTLGQLPMEYAKLSQGMSSAISPAAQFAGQQAGQAAVGLGGTQAAFWSQLGQQQGTYNQQGYRTGSTPSTLGNMFSGIGGLFGGSGSTSTSALQQAGTNTSPTGGIG